MEQRILFSSISIEEFTSIVQNCVKSELANHTKNDHNPEDDKLLSIEEVITIFGVSKVTIHKWKKAGLLPYHKLKRKLYFKKNEILNALKSVNNKSKK
jgi:hypothetical protein